MKSENVNNGVVNEVRDQDSSSGKMAEKRADIVRTAISARLKGVTHADSHEAVDEKKASSSRPRKSLYIF